MARGSLARAHALAVWMVAMASVLPLRAMRSQDAAVARATRRVRVVDDSGMPVARALVQASTWIGYEYTDSAGLAVIAGVPPSTELRVRCETRRRLGLIDRRESVILRAGADTQVVVRCAEPPVRSDTVELRGFYHVGFESSVFRPCDGMPPGSRSYALPSIWVTFAPTARIEWPRRPHADVGGHTIHVRWRGILTGPGRYGHMGAGLYEFTVREVMEVRHSRPDACR
jgi:hypothetical protein